MAKKVATKSSPKAKAAGGTAPKAAAPKAKAAPAPAAKKAPAKTPAAAAGSKYDQPGAPWWKKIPARTVK